MISQNNQLKELMNDMQNRANLIFESKQSEVTAMTFNKDFTCVYLGFRNGKVLIIFCF
jgi:hypothetical protein